jgi:small subunit ribosomal protein S9
MEVKKKLIYQAIGRRKCAVAKISLLPGNGNVIINNEIAEKYFKYNLYYLKTIKSPLEKLEYQNSYEIHIEVFGGGLTGQSEAIRLGISRALCNINIENRSILKSEKFLRCDSRVKERRKYGLKKARKASQYSKR